MITKVLQNLPGQPAAFILYNLPMLSQTGVQALRGYQLLECLGQGGFGAVYRAFQPTVAREVAIKVILPQYANHPDFIRRFEAEAQLVARLEHPHIIPLYDFWRDPEGAYLVMRYVRGGSLRQLLGGTPPDLALVLTVLEQISAALDAAHRHQVIHRDVKPDNILLDEDGNAYLSDFGIAQILKAENAASGQAEGEALTGSLGYLSPEQARGDPLTPRSDLYSLAVIAFELLAGKHPFYQYSPTLQMFKHLTEALPPIAHFRADLPSSVDEVLQRASSKQPEIRYASAGEFAQALRQAISGSHQALPGTPESLPQTLPVSNPYKGLRAFEEADAEDFFGRETLVRKLLERLETPTTFGRGLKKAELEPFRFLAVLGPSGSGKSSVVKAGLIPALRRGFLPGSSSWIITQMTPTTRPMEQLENELLTIAARPVSALRARLNASPTGLRDLLPELLAETSGEIFLVIDQFEELFTQEVAESERLLFMDCLRLAVTAPESRLRLVITLRADFYDRPLRYAGFGQLLQKRTEVVLPLSPAEISQAILGPAERAGVTVEAGLAMEIAVQVAEQPGALPLLQYALTELFDRREGLVLTRAAYQSLGGVLGALTRRAEEVYQALEPAGQEAAKLLFQRLVTLGEGAQDTRRRALQAELDQLAPQMHPVVETYGRARLLSFDRDPISRAPTVEVAHEALIREWQTLRDWLNDNREGIRLQQHLTLAAQEWQAQNRDPGDLYRGARLAQLKEWSESHPRGMNALEQDFFAASLAQADLEAAEKEAQRQRELETAQKLAESERVLAAEQAQAAASLRKRGRYLFVALCLAVALLGAATWLGYQSQQNFLQSERLRLAAQASALLLSGAEVETAPLLSLASLQMGYSREADATLQRAMTITYPARLLGGQQGAILAAVFSPDSRLVATGSATGHLNLWEVASGKLVRSLPEAQTSIASLAFSPDGRLLAAGGDDQTVRLWDLSSGQVIRKFQTNKGTLWSLAFSPDGASLAAMDKNGTLRLWNLATGANSLIINLPTTSSSLAFAPDGQSILTAGDDGVARLLDSATGEVLREFHGHSLSIISVAFAHHGKFIATGSDDKTTRLWDVASGQEIRRLEGHQESVYGVSFSPDDTAVLTAGYDRVALLWDVETGVILNRFIGHQGSLYAGSISPDSRWVLTASLDTTARLWPSGLMPNPRRLRQTSSIITLALNRSGRLLATGASSGTVTLWETRTGQKLREISGHQYAVESLAFAPDEKSLASASDDNTVRVVDLETGQLQLVLEGFSGPVWAVRFTPDGTALVTANEDGLKLWDAASGELRQTFSTADTFYSAAFSPDGQTLLAGGYHSYFVFSVATGQELFHQLNPETRSAFTAAISPDGTRAVLGGGQLTLFEYPSMKVVRVFAGHTGSVLSAAFSVDGKRLVSSSEDGTARLWDLETGENLRIISGSQALASSAAFTPDGKGLYVGGGDNTVWLWDTEVRALMTYACQVVNRDLTAAEREKYNLPGAAPVCPGLK